MSSKRMGAVLACAALAACGSGGGSSNNAGTGAARYGSITLASHDPASDAVQVAIDASITLRFDAAVVADSLLDADTWLRAFGGTDNIAGSFRLTEAGRAAVFTPGSPLLVETDYVFQVSALTCDVDGHLLDETHRFTFRTLDTTAPTVVSANVTAGQQNRSRTAPLVLTMSEVLSTTSLGPTTVLLRDAFGQSYACDRAQNGSVLTVQPLADLPGDRNFTLTLTTGVRDRADNHLAATWQVGFRTASDALTPTVLGVWPADNSTGISPLVQPVIEFSESMDPLTVEPASLLFQDEFGSLVAFTVVASDDQRTLRVRPLHPLAAGRDYVLAFLVGGAGVTDVSGNALGASQALAFTTGTDIAPPAVADAQPASNESRVSINATPTVTFDEALDPAWVDDTTVTLWQDGEPVAAVVTIVSGNAVRATPVLSLEPQRSYRLVLAGGHQGLRDHAGNVLPADLEFAFATAADGSLPGAMLQPADGAVAVPSTAHASVVFDSPLDRATVSTATCELRDDTGNPLPASVTLDDSARVIAIRPNVALTPGSYYRTFVRGGPTGVRESSGNWLGDDLRARFRIGSSVDHNPPAIAVTVNGIDSNRRSGLVLPPSGFTVDVTASDPEQSLDMGTVRVLLSGALPGPTPVQLFTPATVGFQSFHVAVPAGAALAAGSWTLSVQVSDLTGNTGTSASIALQIASTTADLLPFESTQVVWVRTDLDRDGNGIADFDDDMLRLGLATAGNPAGTNAAMHRLLLDAILARSNSLYHRGSSGEPLGADSVPIRMTTRQPVALKHMQIALGGLDPEGNRARRYGDSSTGILGRAFFDYRNGNMNDRNIGTSPGLGVFPGEMWLYQTEIHRQVYPSFQTMFAQRFLPLCPSMGGTPAGSHALDATVLANGFDPDTAPSEQRARWLVLTRAVDDWAMVTGTVLAHEIGHAVGLVAPGPAPTGLFGDQTLHDSNAGAAEVMAAAVGYEAMITLDYTFRDTDLAYLRQRLLLR